MLFTCDVASKYATTSTDGGKSPYVLSFGTVPTPDILRAFGAVGYARRSVREYKMAPKGEKSVFMGILRNLPSPMVSVLLVKTKKKSWKGRPCSGSTGRTRPTATISAMRASV